MSRNTDAPRVPTSSDPSEPPRIQPQPQELHTEAEAEASSSSADNISNALYTDPDVKPLWTPDPRERTSTHAFLELINARVGAKEGEGDQLQLKTYEDLWRRSCTYPSDFWAAVWDFVGVVGERGRAGGPGVKRKRDQARDVGEERLGRTREEAGVEGVDLDLDSYSNNDYSDVVDERATPADNPRWFTGAKLNWAENMLPPRVRAGEAGQRTALVQVGE